MVECLQSAIEKNKLAIHSYVLMTNHVHLLASAEVETSISKTLQSVGRRYVQYFNYTYKRTGTLWEDRYKATVIGSEQYLLTCMRYIELNPVRADMVKKPNASSWSSYAVNAEGKTSKLIKTHDIYRKLGVNEEERQSAYRQLFRVTIGKSDLDDLREATIKAGYWVGVGFVQKLNDYQGDVPSQNLGEDQRGLMTKSSLLILCIVLRPSVIHGYQAHAINLHCSVGHITE